MNTFSNSLNLLLSGNKRLAIIFANADRPTAKKQRLRFKANSKYWKAVTIAANWPLIATHLIKIMVRSRIHSPRLLSGKRS